MKVTAIAASSRKNNLLMNKLFQNLLIKLSWNLYAFNKVFEEGNFSRDEVPASSFFYGVLCVSGTDTHSSVLTSTDTDMRENTNVAENR